MDALIIAQQYLIESMKLKLSSEKNLKNKYYAELQVYRDRIGICNNCDKTIHRDVDDVFNCEYCLVDLCDACFGYCYSCELVVCIVCTQNRGNSEMCPDCKSEDDWRPPDFYYE